MKKLIYPLILTLLLASCSNEIGVGTGIERVSPESVGLNPQHLAYADDVFNDAIKAGDIPGAVFAIVKDGKLAHLKAYGNKSVYPDTVAMTENTIFDMASVSKCIGTTPSILQLLEQGKIRLTDRIDMYIPDFAPWVDQVTGREFHITIADLMSHSSGLLPYINTASYLKKYGENSADSLIKHIATEITRMYKPTTGYTYSCLNFITLQNILQNVTGELLCDFAAENVFAPLGLKHTSYLPLDPTLRERSLSRVAPDFMSLVAPSEVINGKALLGEVHDPTARLANMGNSGNAGVFSNAEDLAVIAACILGGGEFKGTRILSPLTIETMLTNPKTNDPHIERCLGWDTYTSGPGTKGDIFLTQPNTFVHTGYTGTSMMFDMDNNCCVIILTHRVHPKDDGSIARTRALVTNIVAGSFTE